MELLSDTLRYACILALPGLNFPSRSFPAGGPLGRKTTFRKPSPSKFSGNSALALASN
jgi:hypothetical protein